MAGDTEVSECTRADFCRERPAAVESYGTMQSALRLEFQWHCATPPEFSLLQNTFSTVNQ